MVTARGGCSSLRCTGPSLQPPLSEHRPGCAGPSLQPPLAESTGQGARASIAAALGLWSTGLVTALLVGSSQTRDQTCVSRVGRAFLHR